LRRLERECPTCRADLSLLVNYVEDLDNGIADAERLTRQGDLAGAVWAYLGVLDVDPDNATARQRVGQVAAAVRHFDQTLLGRLRHARRKRRLRQWARDTAEGVPRRSWWSDLLVFLAILAAFLLGYWVSLKANQPAPPPQEEARIRAVVLYRAAI
jgi:hypothetical protein